MSAKRTKGVLWDSKDVSEYLPRKTWLKNKFKLVQKKERQTALFFVHLNLNFSSEITSLNLAPPVGYTSNLFFGNTEINEGNVR